MESRLVVVDEHARGDVHRVHEAETLSHAALPNRLFDFAGDVHEIHALGDMKGQRFPKMLHPDEYTGTRPLPMRTMLTPPWRCGYGSRLSHPANTPRSPMPIDITDDRARVDVIRLLGPTKTIQPMRPTRVL